MTGKPAITAVAGVTSRLKVPRRSTPQQQERHNNRATTVPGGVGARELPQPREAARGAQAARHHGGAPHLPRIETASSHGSLTCLIWQPPASYGSHLPHMAGAPGGGGEGDARVHVPPGDPRGARSARDRDRDRDQIATEIATEIAPSARVRDADRLPNTATAFLIRQAPAYVTRIARAMSVARSVQPPAQKDRPDWR